jgi:hypothetical protein
VGGMLVWGVAYICGWLGEEARHTHRLGLSQGDITKKEIVHVQESERCEE